jgi:hypothetical protein
MYQKMKMNAVSKTVHGRHSPTIDRSRCLNSTAWAKCDTYTSHDVFKEERRSSIALLPIDWQWFSSQTCPLRHEHAVRKTRDLISDMNDRNKSQGVPEYLSNPFVFDEGRSRIFEVVASMRYPRLVRCSHLHSNS